MISVIAASLLTATVVFTGCGGGGASVSSSSSSSVSSSSSSSVSSSSSSSVSSSSSSSAPASSSSSSSTSSTCLPGQPCGGSSSSSSAPTIKTVKVSDGYVLQATVKCKETNGSDIAQAVATNNPGEYQFADVASCPVLCAKDGVIDANANGQVDAGEPYAPKMTAPGSYANINPYTVLIQNGMTPAEVAAAFNLPADTNFDIAIPESSADVRKNAVLLSAILSYIEKNSGGDIRSGAFPGLGNDDSSVSSTSSSVVSSSSILTFPDLIASFKSGKTIEDILAELPESIRQLKEELDQVADPEEYDQKAVNIIAQFNGAYSESSSSNESSSGSECIPGTPCGSSSSQATSSSSISSQASSSSTGAFPGLGGGESSSSSQATSSSSSSVSSSSSSQASSSSTGAFPGLGG